LVKNAMPGAQWFTGAHLNYAQQVFRHVEAAHAAGLVALVSRNEQGLHQELSWPELQRQAFFVMRHATTV
jgi:acetoacetyl-CoA synthetase